MDAQQTKSPSLMTNVQINPRICQHAFKFLPDNLRQKSLGHFNQTLFFPFSCSPRPSQSCLSRFGHQILYTNIEGTRRPQSVPTILTETVVQVYVSIYIYLSGFVKAWLKKFQMHFNYLTSKWNGK